MSEVTLKRSLFIGLGGTGAAALLQTKKRFLDTYGEVPPMISFLAIDTDFNTESKYEERENVLKIHKEQNQHVTLDKSELLYTKVQGAHEVYKRKKDTLFSWVPEKNEHAIRNMLNGAGQIRTNGRFALHFNYKQIINSVQTKIDNLLNINIPDNSRFQPKGNGIEINFVFSVSGGTGSGTFIDIAYLVREAVGTANSITTIAFIVMPGIFTTIASGPSMMNVRPNSYGAFKDLDFLMRNDIDKLGLELVYEDKTIRINNNPFDVVFTVNNKNTAGETLLSTKDISEQIGLAMFTGSSEISQNINSAYDNVSTVMAGGSLDVANKRAWAGGMGVSELFYDGNTLGNIYALKAVALIINNLTTATNDSHSMADNFIDDPEIMIRENDGNDHLIDNLLSKTPRTFFPLIEANEENIKAIITGFLDSLRTNSEHEIQQNYDLKIKLVRDKLEKKLIEITNKDSGVANAGEFLDGILAQLNVFISEMEEEEQELNNNIKNIDMQIDSEISYLEGQTGFSSIFKGNEIKNTRQSLTNNVNQKALLINEILRRQFALRFFRTLIEDINTYKSNINTLLVRLQNVKREVLQKIAGKQNSIKERKKTFVIDLHKEDINRITISEDDYIIPDFVNTLNLTNKIYDLHAIGEQIIEEHIFNYTKELPKAKSFVNKSIDDILRNYTEEQKEEYAKQLISKSNALWNYDFKGYKVSDEIHDDFVIGLPSDNSTFKESFESLMNAQNIQFVKTGIKNKIICYRMEVAVPIYAVFDMEGYEADYNRSRICHHIDANWLTKMERMNFSIWPEEKEDHSLEAWVLGIIYGLIKFDKQENIYKIYSEDKGDALDDYWTKLSQYRDEAFDFFKRDNFIDEIIKFVETKRRNAGEDETKRLMNDVKENYRDKYSQINLSPEDLKKREYAKIADLLRSEIDFTRKELVKQL